MKTLLGRVGLQRIFEVRGVVNFTNIVVRGTDVIKIKRRRNKIRFYFLQMNIVVF